MALREFLPFVVRRQMGFIDISVGFMIRGSPAFAVPDSRIRGDMKPKKEKLKRVVKYWRVRYMQASRQERLSAAMFIVVMLTYVWWAILVL